MKNTREIIIRSAGTAGLQVDGAIKTTIHPTPTPDAQAGDFLAFSDGTLAQIFWDGGWEVRLVRLGISSVWKRGPAAQGGGYILQADQPIGWVVTGNANGMDTRP